jgi:predicted nucleic acid-binding protein
MDDERNPASAALFETISLSGAIVPNLWPYEVANSLTMAVKRGRISSKDRFESLKNLAKIDIRIDNADIDLVWHSIIALADLHSLTIYDAAYLELAQRMRVPLATLDDALIRACKASAVSLVLQ